MTLEGAAPPEFGLGGGDLVGVTGAEPDVGTLVEERFDDRPTDAFGPTGHEYTAATELEVHGVPFDDR